MTRQDVENFLNAMRCALGLPGVDVEKLKDAYFAIGYRDTSLAIEKVAQIVIADFMNRPDERTVCGAAGNCPHQV